MEGVQGREGCNALRLRLLGQGIGADLEGERGEPFARIHLHHGRREVPDHRNRIHLHPSLFDCPHVEGDAKEAVRLGAVAFRALDVVGDGARLVCGHPEGEQRFGGEVMHFLEVQSDFIAHFLPSRVPGIGMGVRSATVPKVLRSQG